MKICLINTLYFPDAVGGAEKSVQSLAETFSKKGNEVIVLSLSKNESVQYINNVKIYKLNLFNIYWPFDNPKKNIVFRLIWHLIDVYNYNVGRAVSKIIADEKPDIIHTNNLAGFSPSIWNFVSKQRIPIVHTIRDYYLICARNGMYKNGNNCTKQCMECRFFTMHVTYLSKKVNGVVGISHFLLNMHLEYGLFKNALKFVIHNSYKNKFIKTRSSLLKGNVIFGFIGRLSDTKGIDILLRAFLEFSDKNWKLKIAGKGEKEYLEYLRGINNDSRIEYKGFVKPEEFYPEIDVLIIPSIWNEPLGRVVFEAYSYGIPVIASRRGGISEIVKEGKTGYLFEPSKEGQLSKCIKKFVDVSVEYSKMSKTCIEYAEEFNPERIIKQYEMFYNEVIKVFH